MTEKEAVYQLAVLVVEMADRASFLGYQERHLMLWTLEKAWKAEQAADALTQQAQANGEYDRG